MKLLVLKNQFAAPIVPERMCWTASSLKLFRKCKRRFFWKYIYRLTPNYINKDLAIGSAFHDLLAKWYRGKRSDMAALMGEFQTRLQAQFDASASYYDQDDRDDFKVLIDTFQGMMMGYALINDQDRQAWDIKRPSIEQEFKIDMGDFDFAGKIDLVAKRRGGGGPMFIIEHKTASSIRESYIDRLPLDTQIRGYIFGATQGLGYPIQEVLYDVVKKCKLRQKKTETVQDFTSRIQLEYTSMPAKYFYREELAFDKDDIEAFVYEMRQTHNEFMTLISRWDNMTKNALPAGDPRTWTPNDQACDDFFRTCDYHNLCTQGLDRGTGKQFEQKESLHEELSSNVE